MFFLHLIYLMVHYAIIRSNDVSDFFMLRVYVPLFAMPSDFNVDNPIVYFSPINIQLPLYIAHHVPNDEMSKNNFWGVKPFKYNGLASQLIDK